MSNLRKRHLPDVLCQHLAFCIDDASSLVGLIHAHVTTREVGDEHTEGDGDEQQGLEVLHDAEVQQHEGQQVHDKIGTVGRDDVAERGHLVHVIKYFFHNC